MKTRIIISVIIYTLFPFKSIAQTYYHNETKTFYEDGYTYQCDVSISDFVTLYNVNNIYTYQDMYYQDGSGVFRYNGKNSTMEDDTWTKPKCFSIVNNAFTPTEKKRVKDEKLGVSLIISHQTGKVIEVHFSFFKNDPLATIPVPVYRKMELQFKSDIWFIPTAEGKKLNYIMCGWVHEIE